jgi:CBS domain-containing protein
MQARDLMTTGVVSVSPETPVREVAHLLLQHKISAAPVVDATGMVIGMVSEGDLIGRSEAEREARRDWWLALLEEGEPLNPDFLAALRQNHRTARDVMSAPVIRVTEATEAGAIAALLAQYRIKRVPVVRDGKLVGIVSRADLLRAISDAGEPQRQAEPASRARNLLGEAMASLDRRFFGHDRADAAPSRPQATAEGALSVADFRSLVTGFERHKAEAAAAEYHAALQRRSGAVKRLIDEHIRDDNWKALLHRAQEAAERGDREFMLLRFPSDLCNDRGRAINSALPEWPQTLRGEAAEVYLRWEGELKPRGFRLTARVLDFPGGKPGDIGLFLAWGE